MWRKESDKIDYVLFARRLSGHGPAKKSMSFWWDFHEAGSTCPSEWKCSHRAPFPSLLSFWYISMGGRRKKGWRKKEGKKGKGGKIRCRFCFCGPYLQTYVFAKLTPLSARSFDEWNGRVTTLSVAVAQTRESRPSLLIGRCLHVLAWSLVSLEKCPSSLMRPIPVLALYGLRQLGPWSYVRFDFSFLPSPRSKSTTPFGP